VNQHNRKCFSDFSNPGNVALRGEAAAFGYNTTLKYASCHKTAKLQATKPLAALNFPFFLFSWAVQIDCFSAHFNPSDISKLIFPVTVSPTRQQPS
jgi:C4-dicarboxylate transporter